MDGTFESDDDIFVIGLLNLFKLFPYYEYAIVLNIMNDSKG